MYFYFEDPWARITLRDKACDKPQEGLPTSHISAIQYIYCIARNIEPSDLDNLWLGRWPILLFTFVAWYVWFATSVYRRKATTCIDQMYPSRRQSKCRSNLLYWYLRVGRIDSNPRRLWAIFRAPSMFATIMSRAIISSSSIGRQYTRNPSADAGASLTAVATAVTVILWKTPK